MRSLPLVAPDNEKFRSFSHALAPQYAVYAYSYQRDIAQVGHIEFP